MKHALLLTIICGWANLAFSQNFGIGISSPSEKLDVNGNIRATGSITAQSGEFISTGVNCSSTRDNFPPGISYFVPSSSDGSCPYSFGNIMTINAGNCRTTQIYTGKNSAGVWYRGENCGPWGAWIQLNN